MFYSFDHKEYDYNIEMIWLIQYILIIFNQFSQYIIYYLKNIVSCIT